MAYPLTLDDIERYTAAAAACPADLMDSATDAFAIMAAASHQGELDATTAAATVVGDTCLQLCTLMASTWKEADDKTRFLTIMIPWAWPREPALGAVLEAARRAEAGIWGLG